MAAINANAAGGARRRSKPFPGTKPAGAPIGSTSGNGTAVCASGKRSFCPFPVTNQLADFTDSSALHQARKQECTAMGHFFDAIGTQWAIAFIGRGTNEPLEGRSTDGITWGGVWWP